jgi:hypothetical protein
MTARFKPDVAAGEFVTIRVTWDTLAPDKLVAEPITGHVRLVTTDGRFPEDPGSGSRPNSGNSIVKIPGKSVSRPSPDNEIPCLARNTVGEWLPTLHSTVARRDVMIERRLVARDANHATTLVCEEQQIRAVCGVPRADRLLLHTTTGDFR